MSLAGWAFVRLASGGALASLALLALLTTLPAPLPQGPAVVAPPPEKTVTNEPPAAAALHKGDKQIEQPPLGVGKKIRTIPIYVAPADGMTRPRPARITAAQAPPAPAPAPAATPLPAPAQNPPAAAPRHRAERPEKPADRFARFCKGRGPHSWMRVNGRKRYCK